MADDAAAPEGELTEATENSPESSPEGSTESPEATDRDLVDGDLADVEEPLEQDARPARTKRTQAHVGLGTATSLVVVLALGGLVGWLGWRAYQSHQAEQQRALFLQVGKQAAINLTTIDFEHADTDVKRIIDSATDTFYDDFSKRSQPFVDVVKQARSKSTGEVTAAGVESETGDSAQVLVAVTVKTSNAGAPEQEPRAWRMRISVKKVDNDAKVSNVEFVP